jgi:hypothetical protein
MGIMDTAANPQVVATVISVSGMAFARNADGAVRRLAVGDSILDGEIVFTLADGQVELTLSDGHSATILASESYQLGMETLAPTQPIPSAAAMAAAGEVGKVTQALQEGGDILEELEPTAAGAAGAGAENSGNSFVRLLRITEGVTPIGFEFPVNPTSEIRAPEGNVIPEKPEEPEEPENGLPEAGPASATVDDEGLAGGIAGGTGDVAGEATTFNDTLPFNFGPDGAGSIDFAAMAGQTATVGTETVTYSWSDATHTLTATVTGGDRDGTSLFTVQVNPATGDYTVTLWDNVLHESLDGQAGDNTENDATVALTFTVTDSNGDSKSNTLTVNFDDDTPVAQIADTGVLSNQLGVVLTGDLNIVPGADAPLAYTLNLLEGAEVIGKDADGNPKLFTSNGEPLTWHYDSTNGYWVAQDGNGPIFTVQVNTNGTYTVEVVGLLDGAKGQYQIDLSSGVRGGNTYDLALFDVKAINHGPNDNDADNDGVADFATHMIFVRGVDTSGVLDTINSSTQGMGVGQGTTIDNPDEKQGVNPPSEILTIWFAAPQPPTGIADPQTQLTLDPVGKVAITFDQLSVGESALWTAIYVDGSGVEHTVGSGSVAGIGSGSSDASDETLTIQGIGDFNKLVFTAAEGDEYRIAGVTGYSEQEGYDITLTLPVTATDADGDATSTTFDVWFNGDGDGSLLGFDNTDDVIVSGTESETLYGKGGDDQLYGDGGDDVLGGGTGNDTMTGDQGSDTFKWLSGDEGSPVPIDTITDFDTVAGSDKLDLSELLQAEGGLGAEGLSDYLSFAYDLGSNSTTIEVRSAGLDAAIDQYIVLQGVDLTAGNTLTDIQIIQSLLDSGKLITD